MVNQIMMIYTPVLAMSWLAYWLIAIPVLAGGWVAYWLWQRKIEEEEKSQPKQESQRLTKTKSEVSDWAKKMATFESPAEQARKRKLAQQKALEEKQRQQEQKNQQ
jgi:Na+/glutamate symporter